MPGTPERPENPPDAAPGLRALLRHARPHRTVLGVVLTLTLASSAAGLAQPLVAQDVLSALSGGRPIGGHLLLLVGLLTGSAVLTSASIWLAGRTSERIVLRMRRSLIHRLLRLRVAEAERHAIGDLTTRVTSDTVMLQAGASGGLVQVLDGAVTVVAAFVLMAVLDATLFGVTCGVLVAVAVLIGVIVPRIRAASRRGQAELGNLGASLERALSANRTMKAASAEGFETERAGASAELAYRAGLRTARYDALIGVISGMAIQASFLVVIGVGGVMVAGGSLDVATLVAFLLFLFRIMGPVTSLITGVSAVSQAMGALGRIDEVSEAPVEDDVDDDHPRPARGAPTLALEEVGFGYPGRPFRLDRISLDVAPGTRVALVGPSGAGKTTVFSLIERFHDPDAGRILIDGVDVTTMTRARLRSRIAYVEQDSTMLSGSLRDNVCYGLGPVTDEAVAQALSATELAGFVADLPDGLDTEVGARGAMLSGGQRQRLAIARALLREPDVLLLDESTAALDARNEEALRRTVAAATRTCTVLMIAHRLSTVCDADMIVVLQDGRIRETGSHDDLLVRDALYRELATTQLLAPETPAHADVGTGVAQAVTT